MNVNLIRDKIKDGTIQTWQDVYGYTTPQDMATVFGGTVQHWGEVRNRPLRMRLEDMDKIMEEFDLTRKQFLKLVGGGD